jgi:diguanylate cyclase (GGDEF)-like protein
MDAIVIVAAGAAVLVAAGAATAVEVRRRLRRTKQALERSERARSILASELESVTKLFSDHSARRAELAAETDQLDAAAFDPVSGLLREQFIAVLIQQRVATARRQLHPVTVIAMELDGLRGSTAPTVDEAMRALGSVVRGSLREADCACRVGDVIVIAALDNTTEDGARAAVGRIQAGLRVVTGYTISAGIAAYPSHALEAPDVVARAGAALLAARAEGRNRVTVAEDLGIV